MVTPDVGRDIVESCTELIAICDGREDYIGPHWRGPG